MFFKKYDDVIELFKKHEKFTNDLLHKRMLIGISKLEDLNLIINSQDKDLFDIEKVKLPISRILINEDMLIKFFKIHPNKLDKKEVLLLGVYNSQFFEGNIFDYAVYYNYMNLLAFLFENIKQENNKSEIFEVNSLYLVSVKQVSLLLENGIHIQNKETNIFYLEFLLQQGKEINNINDISIRSCNLKETPLLIAHIIEKSEEFSLEVIKMLLSDLPIESKISQSIIHRIKKDNTNHEYDELIEICFAKKAIAFNDFEGLSKYFPSIFSHLVNSETFISRIPEIKNPKILLFLLERKFPISKAQLKEVILVSSIQNDKDTTTQLIKGLSINFEIALDPYVRKDINFSSAGTKEEERHYLYGDGITQVQYLRYQQELKNIILANILNGTFSLLAPDEYLEQEKSQQGCNIVTMGYLRQWIAEKSYSENSEKFGSYRFHELFYTPCSATKYSSYFKEFLNEKFDLFFNTEYLDTSDFNVYKGMIIPVCTINGNIDNQKVQLTKYEKSGESCVWIHTECEKFPKILSHCQRLLNQIVSLDISSSQDENFSLLVESIGRLHWWLSHAAIYERGSASISEAVCMALFEKHGFSITWTSMPDCEALISPSEEAYAKNYHLLIQVLPLELKENLAIIEKEENIQTKGFQSF